MVELTKKASILLLFAAVIFSLAACAPAQAAPSNAGSNAGSNQSGNFTRPTQSPSQALESKLAAGTLKLEGTSQAVTPAEAQKLLPLWQQVQSDEAGNPATPSDLQTVYQQIEADMTSAQIQAIQNMSLTQSDIQSLMQQYGIQVTPGAGNFQGINPSQRATFAAQRGTPNPNRTGSGFTRSGTPGPNGFGGRGGFGESRLFVNAVIQMLQQKAGS
jgi:hypothetical protein